MSLYAIAIRGRDGQVALSVRILNQPWSAHSVWLDSSEIRPASSLYWDFHADVFDQRGDPIAMWCVDDSSPISYSKYVVLKPGEHVSAVLKPWCPGWFRSDQVLFFQTKWFDNFAKPPPAPSGAVFFRGPLVAPITKYDPATTTENADWSKLMDQLGDH